MARTQARAVSVVAGLFQYWCDMAYLVANLVAGLARGLRGASAFRNDCRVQSMEVRRAGQQ